MKDENVKKCIICKARLVNEHFIPICARCKRKCQNKVAFAVPIIGVLLKLFIGKGSGTKRL